MTEPQSEPWVVEVSGDLEEAVANRSDFREIPAWLKNDLDVELRRQAFDLLHAEMVARGDLDPPPRPFLGQAPASILRLVCSFGGGGLLGLVGVVLAVLLLRYVTSAAF